MISLEKLLIKTSMDLGLNSKEMKDRETEKWRIRKGELHLKIDMDWVIVWDSLQILEVHYLDLEMDINLK